MNSLLEQLRSCTLRMEYADYLDQPEYQALSDKEKELRGKLTGVMGERFAEEYDCTVTAVGSYACSSWFQKGVRLGAQLMLAMQEPL